MAASVGVSALPRCVGLQSTDVYGHCHIMVTGGYRLQVTVLYFLVLGRLCLLGASWAAVLAVPYHRGVAGWRRPLSRQIVDVSLKIEVHYEVLKVLSQKSKVSLLAHQHPRSDGISINTYSYVQCNKI
jgi:hypothetical protein